VTDFLPNAFGVATPVDVPFRFSTESARFAFNDRPDNSFPLFPCACQGLPSFAHVCGKECDPVYRRVAHFPECNYSGNVVFSRVPVFCPECDKACPPTPFAAFTFGEAYPTFPGVFSDVASVRRALGTGTYALGYTCQVA